MKIGLRYKFIGITLLSALPFLLYAAIHYQNAVTDNKNRTISRNLSVAEETAEKVADFINSSQSVLYSLALHPAIINHDSRKCDEIFEQLLRAGERFLHGLEGVTDPEKKRKAIGATFIDVFDAEAAKLGQVDFLAQGTLYPDVIESISIVGQSSMIKSHHNVGGLPERMRMTLVEPLRELFKDEVREVGRKMGLEEGFVVRQPFPGPGLAVRILGEVTADRLSLLRRADAIVSDEVRRDGWYTRLWQSFAVLLPVQSVGVMGDERTYEYTVAIRAVESRDGMTADWARLPHDLLERISSRIVNEVKGINRVVYDISSKPPSTIEWE